MILKNSSVLHINLSTREFSVKTYPDLKKYVGGVGMGSKLMLDYFDMDPIVFTVGPLNGFFPFASKTCVIFKNDDKLYDTYGGGKLSTRIRFCGFDSIILEGESSVPLAISITDNEVVFLSGEADPDTLGIPSKRNTVVCGKGGSQGALIDKYFRFGEPMLAQKLKSKGVVSLCVSCKSNFSLESLALRMRYEKQYLEILKMVDKMLAPASNFNSCSGCPLGCSNSKFGENGGNVLVHSLVGCTYSEVIYSHVPTVFACLSSIGYDYIHEDLEALPQLVYLTIEAINEKIRGSKLETK